MAVKKPGRIPTPVASATPASSAVNALSLRQGTLGDDTLLGTSRNDTLLGRDGNDLLRGFEGNDSIDGGTGHDSLYGDAGNDTISGASGNDLMDGGSGNDRLTDLVGNNTLRGGLGNDIVTAGNGNDSLVGDGGDDLLIGGAGNDTLRSIGTDSFSGGLSGNGRDTLVGGDGNDVFIFRAGTADFSPTTDSISGGSGINTLRFEDGPGAIQNMVVGTRRPAPGEPGGERFLSNNASVASSPNAGVTIEAFVSRIDRDSSGRSNVQRIELASGNDRFSLYGQGPSTGINYLDGGAGNDFLIGTVVLGDTVLGGLGNDTIQGYNSNDTLIGGDGNDSLLGDEDSDSLLGDDGNDTLIGGTGDDRLLGGEDNDRLSGGDGNDSLFGERGSDQLFGDAGDDRFVIGSSEDGIDTIDGGVGSDAIVLTAGASLDLGATVENRAVIVTGVESVLGSGDDDSISLGSRGTIGAVRGGGGNDDISGGSGQFDTVPGSVNQLLDGEAGDDSISGGWGDDTILGGIGDDVLRGGAGNDSLLGGDGDDTFFANDTVSGGGADSGADVLRGGGGNDSFVFGGAGSAAGSLGLNDTISGGTGDDFIVFTGAVGSPSSAYRPGDGRNISEVEGLRLSELSDHVNLAGSGIVSVFGGAGTDTIVGNGLDETIVGGAGNDSLLGGDGDDVFFVAGSFSGSGGAADGDFSDQETVAGGSGFDTLVFDIDGAAGGYELLDDAAGNVSSIEALVFGNGDDRVEVAANLLAVPDGLVLDNFVEEGDLPSTYQGVVYVSAGDGNNTIVIDGDNDSDGEDLIPLMFVETGDDEDLVVVRGASASVTLFANVGGNDDSVVVEGSDVLSGTFDLGEGDDVLIVGDSGGFGFNADTALDTRFGNVDSIVGAVDAGVVSLDIVAGNGDDSVLVEANIVEGEFDLGDGEDIVLVDASDNILRSTFDLGRGDDELRLDASNIIGGARPSEVDLDLVDREGLRSLLTSLADESADDPESSPPSAEDIATAVDSSLVSLDALLDESFPALESAGVSVYAGDGNDYIEAKAGDALLFNTFDLGGGDDVIDIIASDDLGDVLAGGSGGGPVLGLKIDAGDGDDEVSILAEGVAFAMPDGEEFFSNLVDESLEPALDASLEDPDFDPRAVELLNLLLTEFDSRVSTAFGDALDGGIDLGEGDNIVRIHSNLDDNGDGFSSGLPLFGGDLAGNGAIFATAVVAGDGDDTVEYAASDSIFLASIDLSDGDNHVSLITSTEFGAVEGQSFNGNDIDAVSVTAGDGNDTVLIVAGGEIGATGGVFIDVGDGDNLVRLYSDPDVGDGSSSGDEVDNVTVIAGSGDDTVVAAATDDVEDSTFSLGDGDNVIVLATSTFLDTAGDRDVSLFPDGDVLADDIDFGGIGDEVKNVTITAGSGNDNVTIIADEGISEDEGDEALIDVGDGDNTVRLYAGLSDPDDEDADINRATVNAGSGDDTVVAAAASEIGGSGGGTHFNLGDGDNLLGLFTTTEYAAPEDFDFDGFNVNDLTEDDSIGDDATGDDIEDVSITAGSGNDRILIDAADDIEVFINAGNGDNTIAMYAELEEDEEGHVHYTTVTAGTGDDNVLAVSANEVHDSEFFLGAGDDLLQVIADTTLVGDIRGEDFDSGEIDDVTVDGGAGDDRIVLLSGEDVSGISIEGGAGDDEISLYAGPYESFVWPPQDVDLSDSTVNGGAGDDVVSIGAGGDIRASSIDLGSGDDVLDVLTSTGFGPIESLGPDGEDGFLSGDDIVGLTIAGGAGDDQIRLVAGEDILGLLDIQTGEVPFDPTQSLDAVSLLAAAAAVVDGEDFEFDLAPLSIDGGAGNDLIELYAGVEDTIRRRTPNPDVILGVEVVDQEGGDDTVIAVAPDAIGLSSFDLGSGDDVVRLYAGNVDAVGEDLPGGFLNDGFGLASGIGLVNVTTGDGDDQVSLAANNVAFLTRFDTLVPDLEDFRQKVYESAFEQALDSGADPFEAAEAATEAADTAAQTFAGNAAEILDGGIFTGSGDDVVEIFAGLQSGGGIIAVEVDTGDDDDDVLMASGEDIELITADLGSGDDSLTLTTSTDLGSVGGAEFIDGGNINAVTVEAGDGDDEITLLSGEDIGTSPNNFGGDSSGSPVLGALLDIEPGVSIDAGAGNDLVRLYADLDGEDEGVISSVELFGGEGDDSVSVAASGEIWDSTFNLGDGDDSILIANSSLLGNIEGEYAIDGGDLKGLSVEGGSGDDLITLVSAEDIREYVVDTDGNASNGEGEFSFGTLIDGGEGDDTILLFADGNIDGAFTPSIDDSSEEVVTTLFGGDGSDVVVLAAAGNISDLVVDLGEGDNAALLVTSTDVASFLDGTALEEVEDLELGDSFGGIERVTVTAGSGDDSVTLVDDNDLDSGAILIDLGDGTNSASLYAGFSAVDGGNIESVVVIGGSGADTVLLAGNGDITNVELDLGDGTNSASLYAGLSAVDGGDIESVVVIGGSDADTVLLAGNGDISNVELDLGDGDNVVTLVNTNAFGLVEGDALAREGDIYDVTIRSGSGDDVVSLISGDGLDESILIDVGNGDNLVSLFSDLGGKDGDLTVNAGSGSDTVLAVFSGSIQNGDARFDLGDGDNFIRLLTSTELDTIRGYEDDTLDNSVFFDPEAYELRGFVPFDINQTTVTGGDGRDNVRIVAGGTIGGVLIDVGDGDNTVELFADVNDNELFDGFNNIHGDIEDVTVILGSGDDVVTGGAADRIANSTFDLGDGNNGLSLFTSTDVAPVTGFEYDGHVVDVESYAFDGGNIDAVVVEAGDGFDEITLVSGESIVNTTVQTGDGGGSVNLYADLGNNDDGNVRNVDVTTGDGDDALVVAASGNIDGGSEFNLGDGDDSLVLTTVTFADGFNDANDLIAGYSWLGGNIEDVTVDAGDGDDSISISANGLARVSVDAGGGDDTVELFRIDGEDAAGDGFFIHGGDGLDTLILTGNHSSAGDPDVFDNIDLSQFDGFEQLILADGGQGDISLVDGGPDGELFGTDRLRLLRSNGEDNDISLETYGSIENVTVDGAGGDDSFTLGFADLSAEFGNVDAPFTSEFDNVTLVGGSGEDVAVVFSNHENAELSFHGVEGLFLVNTEEVTVDIRADGNLDDTVIIRDGFAGATFNFHDEANATVFGGNGDDVINLLAGGRLVLNEGEDVDSPFFSDGGAGSSVESVFGSGAYDLVIINDGGNDDPVTSDLRYLDLGGGDDLLYIAGNDFAIGGGDFIATLDGGLGDDLLILAGIGNEDSMAGGISLGDAYVIGFETVQGSDLGDDIHIHSDAVLVLGGNGDDFIEVTEDAQIVVGGLGNDFIEAGDGAQVIYGGNFDLDSGFGDHNDPALDFNFGNTPAGGSDYFAQGADDGVAPLSGSLRDERLVFEGDFLEFQDDIDGRNQVDLIYDFQVANDSIAGGGNVDSLDLGGFNGVDFVFGDLDNNNDGVNDFDGFNDVLDADGDVLFYSLVRPDSLSGPWNYRNLEDNSAYYAVGNYDEVTNRFEFDSEGDDLLFFRTDGSVDNQNLLTNESMVILVGFTPLEPTSPPADA